jgi:hypothetical protein
MNIALWMVQVLLAALFLFAGGMKLVLPIEEMTKEIALPGWFLRFIGVAEVLGALGLILPGLFGQKTALTPVAAACLIIIMIGATVITIMIGAGATVVVPIAAGLLSAFVAYGRWRLLPHAG